MINTININNKKSKFLVDDLINDMYLLPKWEKIKEFSVSQKRFFFFDKTFRVNMFRKFSSKHMLEKYLIKSESDEKLALMDLRIYKDNVYIINMDFENSSVTEDIILKLVQTAIEKALYNTSEKEVRINLTFSQAINSKLKKLLLANEFSVEENQSEYEKEMFGETLIYKMEHSSRWNSIIKVMPILINE